MNSGIAYVSSESSSLADLLVISSNTFLILFPLVKGLVAQSCLTLCDPMGCSPPDSSVHGDSPDKNTGIGCHSLLQGIFPTQGSNPGLPHCRQILYFLSHQGSPTFSTYYVKMMILPHQLPCSYILAIRMPPTSFFLFYFTIQDLP